jgi:hypothetical protein
VPRLNGQLHIPVYPIMNSHHPRPEVLKLWGAPSGGGGVAAGPLRGAV